MKEETKTPQQIIAQALAEFDKLLKKMFWYATDRGTTPKFNTFSNPLKSFHTSTLQAFIEAEIERLEGIRRTPNDLKTDKLFCEMAMCQPVWDGNYYTCLHCGIEYVPASMVNQSIDDQISHLKELLLTLKK